MWEYTGDTVILGRAAHILSSGIAVPGQTTYDGGSRYFSVQGDTVSMLILSSWVELWNFSLQVGDSVASPMLHSMHYYGFQSSEDYCDQANSAFQKALVTDVGTDLINEIPLRYYTLKYPNLGGYEYVTYRERDILKYHSSAFFAFIMLCGSFGDELICYSDNELSTSPFCSDISWFYTLGQEKQTNAAQETSIFPNPASDMQTLNIPEGSDIFELSIAIFDINGTFIKSVYTGTGVKTVSSYIGDLNAGIYVYRINTGADIRYSKFIKH